MSTHNHFDEFAAFGEELRSEKRTLAWKICNFEDLPQKRGEKIIGLRSLTCHGHSWVLDLYPRGDSKSSTSTSYVSIYLRLLDGGEKAIKVAYTIRNGGRSLSCDSKGLSFMKDIKYMGWTNFRDRASALKCGLVQGNLLVEVDIEIFQDKTQPLVPRDTLSEDMIRLLESSKGCSNVLVAFVVGDKKLINYKKFYVHSNILATRAPVLAELADAAASGDRTLPEIFLENVDKDIFEALLRYAYASVLPPYEMMEGRAREVLETADKYGCVNLKLLAESKLLELSLNSETAVDLLLLADAKNCALLKEAALMHVNANAAVAMQSCGWADVTKSASLMSDIVTMAHSKKKYLAEDDDDGNADLDRLSVGALRRRLQKRKLSEDGTREMLVDRLQRKTSSE